MIPALCHAGHLPPFALYVFHLTNKPEGRGMCRANRIPSSSRTKRWFELLCPVKRVPIPRWPTQARHPSIGLCRLKYNNMGSNQEPERERAS